MERIAIIGGGAAGLAAAVSAAEAVRAKGASRHVSVEVYEASDRVGKTILATGNGRCNFSNARVASESARELGYTNPRFVEEALGALATLEATVPAASFGDPVLGFFASHGLVWREEAEGRLYPLANKASVVLDVLRSAAKQAGVEEHCGCLVERIRFPRFEADDFMLRMANERFPVSQVVVACGGRVAAELFSDAAPAILFRPQRSVLGPLAADPDTCAPLDNIRVKCALGLWRDGSLLAREEGEALFRRYGVSGIAAFNLSRLAEPGDELRVDLLPHVEDAHAFLTMRSRLLAGIYGPAITAAALLRGAMLPQVAAAVCHKADVPGNRPLSEEGLMRLASVAKGLPLEVEGIGDVRQCQVTRGGIDVGEVHPRNLELRNYPRAYVAGEALDVDAPCGGFNLHWAWASGILAGRRAAESALA